MLNKDDLSKLLRESVSEGMPAAATILSQKIKSYAESNGTPVRGIKVTLLPCSGAGWTTLASQATSAGVGNTFISVGLATELSGSQTTMVTPTGPVQVPCSFNSGAIVGDMSNCKDNVEAWDKIAEAIIKYLKPELT